MQVEQRLAKYKERLERQGTWVNHVTIEYISTDLAAERWGVSAQTVRNWADEGRIEGLAKMVTGTRNYLLIPSDAQAPANN